MLMPELSSEGLPRDGRGRGRRSGDAASRRALWRHASARSGPGEDIAPRPRCHIRSGVEFFEKRVRPILSARCHGCHGPAKQKGGLRLDARAQRLAGGSTGPAVVPGNPRESLLVDAINYGETYQMPPKSKLPPEEIATLTEWVQRGAPWGIGTRKRLGESAGTAKIPACCRRRNSRRGLDTGAFSRFAPGASRP